MVDSSSIGIEHAAVFHNLEPFVLASASPRRQMLLRSVGLAFDVIPSGVIEEAHEDEAADMLAKGWASKKARSVSLDRPDSWILAADTVVVLGGSMFGKPSDPSEAVSMLRQLSGRAHDVITGICLLHGNRHFLQLQAVRTQVHFKELSLDEIRAYVNSGEPLDKAGAYGIQGIGAFLVHSIRGSYTNVVGLPLCETLNWLLRHKIIAPLVKEG